MIIRNLPICIVHLIKERLILYKGVLNITFKDRGLHMEQVLTNDLKVKQERNSAFELLRIFAMFFIVLDHFSVHGGFDFSAIGTSTIVTVNKIWLDFISPLGNLSVDLFILISAFFLANNSKFRVRKILSLLIEMLFFSIVIGIAFIFISDKTVDYELVRTILFPAGSSTWWFMTAYLILYIFSPFLNLGIKAMNNKMHTILIITFINCFIYVFILSSSISFVKRKVQKK